MNKLKQKYHHHHTGYIGNLKSIRYDTLMKVNPRKAMWLAVKGMLQTSLTGKSS